MATPQMHTIRWKNELPIKKDIQDMFLLHVPNSSYKFSMRSNHGDKIFIKEAKKWDIDRLVDLLAQGGVKGTMEYMKHPLYPNLTDAYIRLTPAATIDTAYIGFDTVKKHLIEKGVENLKIYGYPSVNQDNILTDIIYRSFFITMLEDNKGQAVIADKAIEALLSEIEVNREKDDIEDQKVEALKKQS